MKNLRKIIAMSLVVISLGTSAAFADVKVTNVVTTRLLPSWGDEAEHPDGYHHHVYYKEISRKFMGTSYGHAGGTTFDHYDVTRECSCGKTHTEREVEIN